VRRREVEHSGEGAGDLGLDQSQSAYSQSGSSEFDHVAVIGLDAGRFPSRRSVTESEDPVRALEEERRLAYVAWTRARRSLTLVYDTNSVLLLPSQLRKEPQMTTRVAVAYLRRSRSDDPIKEVSEDVQLSTQQTSTSTRSTTKSSDTGAVPPAGVSVLPSAQTRAPGSAPSPAIPGNRPAEGRPL
jgi:ATP-dependent exoDNAse (exonuclease V) beta subunit